MAKKDPRAMNLSMTGIHNIPMNYDTGCFGGEQSYTEEKPIDSRGQESNTSSSNARPTEIIYGGGQAFDHSKLENEETTD